MNKRVLTEKFSNYTAPSPLRIINSSNQYVTNGTDNSYWYYIKDRATFCNTNRTVIKNLTKWIYGRGIVCTNNTEFDLYSIISKEDLKNVCYDLKVFGSFSLQIVYSRDKKSITNLYHTPIPSVAYVNQDDLTIDIENYWLCFDWRNKTKFIPYKVPAYGTIGRGTELFYYKSNNDNILWSLPDYQGALEWCEEEEEIKNYLLKHTKNRFIARTLINVNQGMPESDEAEEEIKRSLLRKVSGENADDIIISLNDNKDNATTVEHFSVPNEYEKYDWISKECKEQILLGHGITNNILFGVKDSMGFGNNADEMKTAMEFMYMNTIDPYREEIIDQLEMLFRNMGQDYKFEFLNSIKPDLSEEIGSSSNVASAQDQNNIE